VIYSKIISTGSYLPKKIITNDDLSILINTNDIWIKKRTGVKQRHISNKNETTFAIGFYAARDAIQNAQIKKSSIDMIIVATATPDLIFPSTACIIQKMLQIENCTAFDIQAACSGFIYAINIANTYIRTGLFKRILVIGSETMSKIVDWTDRSTCVLFGDGAGAIILEASSKPGIISIETNSNGIPGKYLYLKNNYKPSFIKMNGKKIFKLAITCLKQSIINILKNNKLELCNIDWIIPHQANIRIIKFLAKNLKIPFEKFITTMDIYANTSSASIPLTLHFGIKNKKIKSGQMLLLTGFGAGLTWGTALTQY